MLLLRNLHWDESLLCQGLTLHDELQRVLAKYETVQSGVSVQLEKPKPEPTSQDRGTVERVIADAEQNNKQANGRHFVAEASALTPPKAEVKMDLISVDLLGGDDYSSPKLNLALVPISYSQPASPAASNQNALALVDLIYMGPNPSNVPPAPIAGMEIQHQQQHYLHQQQGPMHQNMTSLHEQPGYQQVPGGAQSVQQQQPSPLYQNGIASQMLEQSGYPNMGSAHEQSGYPHVSNPSWGAQSVTLQQQQQPSSPVYGAQNGGSLPLPPWESQSTDIQPFGNTFPSAVILSKTGSPQSARMQTMGGNEQQIVGMFVQPITGSQLMALNQSFQMPTNLSQAMQASQITSMHPHQMYHHQDAHYLDQGMYALSLKDDTALSLTSSNPTQLSVASYMPPVKQQHPKAGDLMFGDLLDMAKVKPAKTPPAGTDNI